jgi:hypothetical protein
MIAFEEHRSSLTRLGAIGLFLLALGVTAVVHISRASEPYTYRHGFISAVFATSARTFTQFGIVKLGAVPVANNPPIGVEDGYGHWPPLFPITLSILFRLFSVSETVAHLWMLTIQIFTALLVVQLARALLGITGGVLAGLFWLTMPVTIHYSHVVLPESLAILLMLVSVVSFMRLRPHVASVATFLAVCASWEAVLLVPGFWAASVVTRNPVHRRTTAFCTLAIVLALFAVVGCYAIHNPSVFADAIQTARFRMGLSHAYSQRIFVQSTERYVGFGESLARILLNFPRMLGLLGSAALVLLVAYRPNGSIVMVYGLGSPWLLWCVLMRNHMAVHDIEMNLAAPLAAIALAWLAVSVLDHRIARTGRWAMLIVICPVILLQLWFGTEQSPENPSQIMGFSTGIRRATDPDAVVLSPLVSAIPLYYSERHLIRCVSDEGMLKHVLPYVREQYPKARLYWATPLDSQPWVIVREVR